MSLFGKKSLCIITGASQGIGQTLAVEFSTKLKSGSTVVLIARSEVGLRSTQDLIKQSTSNISVVVESLDLSKPDITIYKNLMKTWSSGVSYDSYILVHNAGSEGNGQLTAKMSDHDEWITYMSLNLYSVTLLTSAFLEMTVGYENTDKVLINITSLAAVQPFSGLGYYCVGKAAREMYFKTLALENPSLRILSYSPGPVDTSMITRVIDKLQIKETKDAFVSMKEKSGLLSPSQTTARLIGILESNSFTSGQRIDYFDEH